MVKGPKPGDRSESAWRARYNQSLKKGTTGKKKKRKPAHPDKKIEAITLTLAQRAEILMTMSEVQRQAYADHIQLTFSDKVMNKVFEEAPQWRFVGIRIDYGWDYRKIHPERSANLRCVCNRQLRYQYQLVSKDGLNRHVNLGSSHFMQHLGIPTSVAKEVFAQFNQVQKTMDEMLVRYKQGQRFPKGNNARKLLMGPPSGNFAGGVYQRFHWLAMANFPVSKKDHKKVMKIVSQLKVHQQPQPQKDTPKENRPVAIPGANAIRPSKKKQTQNRRKHLPSKAVAMTMAEMRGERYRGVKAVTTMDKASNGRTQARVERDKDLLPRPHAE
jgi:hypothetical protein